MYRIITLLGAQLAFASILSGVLIRHPELVTLGDINLQNVHNHIAKVTSILPVLLLLMAWKQKEYRFAAFSGSLLLLAAVILQVAAGVFLLKDGRFPIVKIGHLLLSTVILGMFFWMFLRARSGLRRLPRILISPSIFARFGMLLVILQIALGAWVNLDQAAMACSDPKSGL